MIYMVRAVAFRIIFHIFSTAVMVPDPQNDRRIRVNGPGNDVQVCRTWWLSLKEALPISRRGKHVVAVL